MDLFEDLAVLAEEEKCKAIQKTDGEPLPESDWRFAGPSREFRVGLERIKAAGGMSPGDLAERIERDHQKNGSTFRTGSSALSGTTGRDSTGVL